MSHYNYTYRLEKNYQCYFFGIEYRRIPCTRNFKLIGYLFVVTFGLWWWNLRIEW